MKIGKTVLAGNKTRLEMVLPDLLAPDLDIVFCGTAVGAVSARRGAYYAGPGNAFWPTLHQVGLTDRQLQPEEYAKLLDYGIGLTDLAKGISGNDDILSRDHFSAGRLTTIIRHYRPRILAFTGKRAAQEYLGGRVEYGRLAEKEDETMLFVLTSPSGAACKYWSTEPWQQLADLRKHRQYTGESNQGMQTGPNEPAPRHHGE